MRFRVEMNKKMPRSNVTYVCYVGGGRVGKIYRRLTHLKLQEAKKVCQFRTSGICHGERDLYSGRCIRCSNPAG